MARRPQSRWRPFDIDWDRVVVDVQGNTITIDAPLTCAIEARWGGGDMFKYDDPGPHRTGRRGEPAWRVGVRPDGPHDGIRQHGPAELCAEEYYADENHYRTSSSSTTPGMLGAQRDGAALRQQHGRHAARIEVDHGAGLRVARADLAPAGRAAVHVRAARPARARAALPVRQGPALVHDRPADGQRNVFLDCRATSPFSSSEPHEQWATGTLYDNVQAPLTARFWRNISIGWAGANTVFWNCEGDFLVQKPPTAQNFSFGHIGINAVVFNIPLQDTTKENGHIESLDRHVAPRSLYLTQLRERLGEAAVRQVALAGAAIAAARSTRLPALAFPLSIIAGMVAALSAPGLFLQWGGYPLVSAIPPLIQIIMFGMGMTLSVADFRRVLTVPHATLVGAALQFGVMPILGLSLARVFGFSGATAAGIVLVGSVPGGVASNVMTYLARGNVALSVTMTAVSTMLSPFMTPLAMTWLAGTFVPVSVLGRPRPAGRVDERR
jgi:hypothetical protein